MIETSSRALAGGAALLTAMSVATAPPAAAQVRREDVSAWGIATLTIPAGDRLEITLDGHIGLNDRATRAGRFFARGLVYYRVADPVQIGGGYGYFYNDEPFAPAVRQHRVFFDLNYRTPERRDATTVQLRTRLERRTTPGGEETAWVGRQLVRVELPITGGDRPVRLVGFHESFVALNGTRWNGPGGHASMFDFLGFALPLGRRSSVDVGYLNNTTFVPGRNRLRHGPAITLSVRL
jgi:hypothetical protein